MRRGRLYFKDPVVWQPGLGGAFQAGTWLHYNLPKPVTFDQLSLGVVADGRHSVPTQVVVSTEHGSRTVDLPPLAAMGVVSNSTATR